MRSTVRFVSLILALLFAVALFAGCGGQQQPEQQSAPKPADNAPKPAETPTINIGGEHAADESTKYADEIVIGYPDVGSVWSPLNPNSAGNVTALAYLMVYNTLIARDKETLGGYVPEVATEWYPNDDYTEWTFKLRDDVYFHNGEHLTAEDVRFSWVAFMEHTGGTGYSKLSDVVDVEIVNDYEVIYHLAGTNVDFEDNVSYHGAMIFCKKAVEADEDLGVQIGSGVWKFEDFMANNYLVLVANENTWEQPALAKKVTVKAVAEQTARGIMFENGEFDFVSDVPAQDRAKYEANPNIELDEFSAIGTLYIAFNMNSPIAGDINFRRACYYAIDRDAINQIATQGVGSVWDTGSYWGRGTAYKKDVPVPERDVDKAKEYLEQSGYKGEKVTLLTVTGMIHADIAQVVQQQFAEIGINIEIFSTDMATMFASTGWGSVSYDMLTFGGMWQMLASSGNFTLQTGLIGNKAQYSNPRVDELLAKGVATPNGPEREAIYYEVQDILVEDLPYIGTLNQNVAYGRQANCGGAIYYPDGIIDDTYIYKIIEE